jgi:hypothetical protein
MATEIDIASIVQVPMETILEESQVQQILASAPFLPIPQALNLRTLLSPSLKPNIVFRSGFLWHLPQSSLIQPREKYKITTIFDLRNRKEREEHPSPQIQGIKTVWIPCSADGTEGIGAAHSNPKQVLHGINTATFVENGGVDGYLQMYENA